VTDLGKAYITPGQIAAVQGWPGPAGIQRARRWIRKAGIGVRVGRYWATTAERLARAFPDLWIRVLGLDL
jgi:hypothetical protein